MIKAGFIPNFVDVDNRTFCIDEKKIIKSINNKTKAISVPNLLGNLPNWKLIKRIAKKIETKNRIKLDYIVGTMIELPRAALQAKSISKHADFFSFGTNDLTQTTLGISRDDSGKFLNDYIDNKIFDIDPFVSIDQNGVGELVELASSRGRKVNKKLKLGICGEHGGDPRSIEFCSRTGLNYVSCSPFRVPVARLAAAQAELTKN